MTPVTRRALLGAAAVALVRPAVAAAAGEEPAAVLPLMRREDAAAAAYALAARHTGDPLLARIAGLQDERTRVLRVQVEALTIGPGFRPPAAELDDPAATRLAEATTRRAALAAAIALEPELVRACADAARPLVDAGLLQTVATIAAGHAQQLAALRAAAGRPALDEAAVSGRWRPGSPRATLAQVVSPKRNGS